MTLNLNDKEFELKQSSYGMVVYLFDECRPQPEFAAVIRARLAEQMTDEHRLPFWCGLYWATTDPIEKKKILDNLLSFARSTRIDSSNYLRTVEALAPIKVPAVQSFMVEVMKVSTDSYAREYAIENVIPKGTAITPTQQKFIADLCRHFGKGGESGIWVEHLTLMCSEVIDVVLPHLMTLKPEYQSTEYFQYMLESLELYHAEKADETTKDE